MAVGQKQVHKPQGRKGPAGAALRCARFISLVFLTLTLCAVFLPSNFASAETLKEKIKAFVEGKADTVLEFASEGRITAIFKSGRALVVRVRNPQQANQEAFVSLVEPDRRVVWERSFPGVDWFDLISEEIGSAKVLVAYKRDESHGVTEIFNSEGLQLSKIEETTILGASPNGVYFHSSASWMVLNPLNVYDSLGNLLWSKSTWPGYWEVAPLSDSLVLYWEPKHLLILDARDGRVKEEIPGERLGDLGSPPLFAASKSGSFFAMFGNSAIHSFEKSGSLLWSATFDKNRERVKDVAISSDGKILALILIQKDFPRGIQVRLLDNQNRGKAISQYNLEIGRPYVSGPRSSFTFTDSMLMLIPLSNDLYSKYSNTGISPAITTKCFFPFGASGSLIDSFTVNGAFSMTESKKLGSQYFQLVHDKTVLLKQTKAILVEE